MRRLAELHERAGGGVTAIGASDTVWMVTDPMSAQSVLQDIYGDTTLASIGRQVKGGLDIAGEHLTLYVGAGAEQAARKDAENRLSRRGSRIADAAFNGGRVTG